MKRFLTTGILVIFLIGMMFGCGKSTTSHLSLQIVSGCNPTAYDTLTADINSYRISIVYLKSSTNTEVTITSPNAKQIDQAQLAVDIDNIIRDAGQDATVKVVVEGLSNNSVKARGVSAPVKIKTVNKNVISVPFFKIVSLSSNGSSSWGEGDFTMIAGGDSPCTALPFPTQGHAATVFNSGHILVTGTSDTSVDETKSAYIIDSYSLTTNIINSTPAELHRAGHDSLLLSDGRVVVIGGKHTTQTVQQALTIPVIPDPGIIIPHFCPISVQEAILVLSGADQMLQSYDPTKDYISSLSFSLVGTLKIRPYNHDAAILKDSQILINDGESQPVLLSVDNLSQNPIPTIDAFSGDNPFPLSSVVPCYTTTVLPTPTSQNSTLLFGSTTGLLTQNSTTNFSFIKSTVSPALASRNHPLAVKLSAYSALFFGPSAVNPQVIYIETNESGTVWISCPVTSITGFPTSGYTVTKLSNGYIFVAGGNATQPGATFYLVPNQDLATCPNFTMYNGPTMLMPRTGHTASLLPDGRLLLVGGASAQPATISDQSVASSAEVITFDQPF